MIDFNDLMSIEDEQEGESCKGRIYRYKESAYINKRGDWCAKQSMILMKRMSCSGCEDDGYKCEGIKIGDVYNVQFNSDGGDSWQFKSCLPCLKYANEHEIDMTGDY